MASPATPGPDREATAFLAAARKVRHALTERDKVILPHRELYDRSQDDLRVMPEKRVKIAGDFLRAALTADHVYEDYVHDALDEFRERMSTDEERRP